MIVVVEKDGNLQEARILADKLNIPLVQKDSPPEESEDLILRFHKEGLSLCGEGLEMQGDLTHMIPRLKKNNLQREFLVKASRIKNLGDHPVAVDATAGMGEDSLLLAAAGYQVILYELNPVIAALLKDSLRRASHIPELEEIVGRMQVREGDSIQGLSGLETTPDLILLDPMFPERKKSGLIKKKFQLLQKLESPCSDEERLFDAAWKAEPRRLVIKRPLKGPYLAGVKPDYSIPGKAIRYDCFVNIKNKRCK